MNDYDITIKISCIPAPNEDMALDRISQITKLLEYLDFVEINVEKHGEWVE